MNYFKYILSNKKALFYWALVCFFVIILSLIGLLFRFTDKQILAINPLTILFLLFWTFAFVMFYTNGYNNLKRQTKFLNKYSKLIDQSSIRKYKIEVFRNSYKVRVIKTSYPATIYPIPKIDTFTILKIENKVVLIGQVYDFGILKRDLRPIVIDFENYKQNKKYKFATTPTISLINWAENNLEIIFKDNLFGISKVKLIDWKKK